MYKHFQGGNAKTICDHINKNGMKIHSVEQRNTVIQCIAEPSDDKRELKACGGSVMQVTKSLNAYGRKIEGKVLIEGNRATAFYRYDEKKEKEMQAEMDKSKEAAKDAAEKAEKEAKKAEMKKKMDELKKEMDSVDSAPSDAEIKKAKEDAHEAKRKAEAKKQAEKKAKADKEAKAKKEGLDKVKKEESKKADK